MSEFDFLFDEEINDTLWFYKYDMVGKKLLGKMVAEEKENSVCSPFSIYMLYMLAAAAAGGESKKEIIEAIYGEENADKALDELIKFQKYLVNSEGESPLISSNGVCVGEEFYPLIKDSFKKLLDEKIDGELFKAGDDAVKVINNWVNEKTEGMIPSLIDSLPGDLKSVLLNAIAFKAKWEKPYYDAEIFEEDFKNIDGSVSKVNLLTSDEELYYEDEDFTGFTKGYDGGKFVFMALLPKEEGEEFLSAAVKRLNLREAFMNSTFWPVDAFLPEFEIKSSADLTDFTKELGIKSILSSEADFSDLTNEGGIFVDSVLQKAYIKLDREGTEAAAVSGMIMRASLPPEELERKVVRLDRPFVYGIMDIETGLPIFSGIIKSFN